MTSFHPFGEKWVLGLRLDYNATSGDAPFFGYPYVSLRGIPALRYQGDRVVTGEIDIAKGPEDYNWYIQVGHAW